MLVVDAVISTDTVSGLSCNLFLAQILLIICPCSFVFRDPKVTPVSLVSLALLVYEGRKERG